MTSGLKKSTIRQWFYKNSALRNLLYYQLKTKRILKRRGGLFLFKKLYKKIRHSTFRTTSSIWLEKSLDLPVKPVLPGIDVTINFLVSDKSKLIEWLAKQHVKFPWMYFSKEIGVATADNHIFVTLLHRDEILGYIKVGKKQVYIHDFDSIVSFPPGTAFIYDTFILPEYRGKHLALYAIAKTIDYLKEKQFKKLWCHIEQWNQASLKTFRKAGFEEKGSIRFTKLCGVPFFIRDGYKPMVSIKAYIS